MPALDLYHALHWIYLHGAAGALDSESFRDAIGPSTFAYYGRVMPIISPGVLCWRILSQLLFCVGSSIIFAAYSSETKRAHDGYRLVGFLWLATFCLDVTIASLASGHRVLLFGSVNGTFMTFLELSVIALFVFPWRSAKQ
jgi:hypothetical protein